jgi:hypothetical protein
MAGLGYKLFSSGEVLTAANLQGYAVDQSVMVFASSAARTAALAAPSQGMVSFLTDSGTYWYYSELYNASTNPGGSLAAGHYPLPSSAAFIGTATRTTTNSTVEDVGAASYLYTELSDGLGWHSAATNTERITPTVAGLYRVTATCAWAGGGTGVRRAQLLRNGTLIAESRLDAAVSSNSNMISHIVKMNGSSDYLNFNTFQGSGGNLAATFITSIEFFKPTIV